MNSRIFFFGFFICLFSSLILGSIDDLASGLHKLSIGREKEIVISSKEKDLIKKATNLDLKEFLKQIDNLPIAPKTKRRYPKTDFLTKNIFEDTAKAFIAAKNNFLKNVGWLKNEDPEFEKGEFFVEKLVLSDDFEIEFHADWHGDVHSFKNWIEDLKKRNWLDNSLKILGENRYIILLGDYTDRGIYGVEVLFLAWQLYLRNPNQVKLLRGNHEEYKINATYGFFKELENKFGFKIEKEYGMNVIKGADFIFDSYKEFPSAILLCCRNLDKSMDVLIICHGGFVIGYDFKKILSDDRNHLFEKLDKRIEMDRLSYGNLKVKISNLKNIFTRAKMVLSSTIEIVLNELQEKMKRAGFGYSFGNGFSWNDFEFISKKEDDKTLEYKEGRSFGIYPSFAKDFFDASSERGKFRVVGLVRGHQHFLMLYDCKNYNKIFDYENKEHFTRLKEGSNELKFPRYSILTLPVSSRTGHYERIANFEFLKNFDTSATLKLNHKGFENWEWELRRIPVTI